MLDNLCLLQFLDARLLIICLANQVIQNLVRVEVTVLGQIEIGSCFLFLFTLIDHIFPYFILEQGPLVADDEQEMLWSCNGNIQSSSIGQKSKTGLGCCHGIRPHTVKDDDLFLPTLESIDSVDLNISKFASHLSQPRPECIFQTLHLCFIRSDDTDLVCETSCERCPP